MSGHPPMHVACATDDLYAQHCGVMLCSLFANNRTRPLHVYVLVDRLSADARDRLDTVAAAYGRALTWVPVDSTTFTGSPTRWHITVTTYYRVWASKLLPADVDRVLFLDVDLLVRRPLDDLYDVPLDGYAHAAVENPFCRADVERLAMPAGAAYFNAGVMLQNLTVWRNEPLGERVVAYARDHADRLLWNEQDALNALLHGRWRRCRATWNAQESFFRPGVTAAALSVPESEFVEAAGNPHIVHFSGSCKPWTYHFQHPFKREYYGYLSLTPWHRFRPADRPAAAIRLRLLAGRAMPESLKRRCRQWASAVGAVGG